jgi:hypothetical protein
MFRLPCCHIIFLLDEALPVHCAVCWLKKYIAYYKRNGYEEGTKLLRELQQKESPGPSVTADNWDLLNQKLGNNQAEYLSIVGEVMFDFFSSIMNSDVPVIENVNHCGIATADEMKHGSHSNGDVGTCVTSMDGGLLSQEQLLTEEVQWNIANNQ